MILVGMALAACAVPIAHAGTIYRCIEGGGGVLYSDAPCPGGRLVPVPEGNVDPHARERLQRDLDAFDRRQSLRNAESARRQAEEAQQRRAQAALRASEAAEPPAERDYPYVYGYPVYYGKPPLPPRPRPEPVPRRDRYIRLR